MYDGGIQIVVQRQALVMVRVDADLGDKCRRCEELHLDAVRGDKIVSGCEGGAEEHKQRGGERECARHGAGMRDESARGGGREVFGGW
jgi:hypothetical protein